MHIDPVAFSVFGFEIRWYGIIIALAVIAGFIIAYFTADYRGQKKDEVINFAPLAIIFSIIGARLIHVLVNWSYYAQHPAYILAFRRGGLAIQGVILGGIIALIVFCKIRKLDFWLWADIVFPGLALGQAIGRWGNFFNQEAYGRPTDLPWKIYIDEANRLKGYESFEYFHPTFLYESISNFLLFILLMLMHRYYRNRPGKIPYGIILVIYMGVYSVYRTIIEYYRIDSTTFDTPFGEVKVVYIINLMMVVAAMLIANHITKKFNEKKQIENNIEE